LFIAAQKAEQNGDPASAEKWRMEATRLLEQARESELAGAERAQEMNAPPKNTLAE
jgi:hypothetical protein